MDSEKSRHKFVFLNTTTFIISTITAQFDAESNQVQSPKATHLNYFSGKPE